MDVMPLPYRYEYWADVLNVIDGDTVELSIELGLDCRRVVKCRLLGIQAPELHGATREAGEAARLNLRLMVQRFAYQSGPFPRLIARTTKDRTEKYGRYLVELLGRDGEFCAHINERMVKAGFAVAWDGKGQRPTAAASRAEKS